MGHYVQSENRGFLLGCRYSPRWITALFYGPSVPVIRLEHNLFKNLSKWVIFLWQTQIQTIKYCPNAAKSYIDTLLIYTFWYEFSNVFVAQSDFDKKNLKKTTHLDHSYL